MKKVIVFFGMLFPILFVIPAFAQSPFHYYLFVRGIDGDSNAKVQVQGRPIDIFSFKEGISQTGTMARGAGGGAGRAQFADLIVTKWIDSASVKLKSACANGQHIQEMILVCVLKGGKAQGAEMYRIKLSDVLVTGVKLSADHMAALEEVTFNYTKVEWEFKPLRPDGSLGAPVKGGYDLKLQKKV